MPRNTDTTAATAAATAARAKRRNDRRAAGLLEDAYQLTDDHRAFLSALCASAPPISEERQAYLRRLLPPVMVSADIRAGVPGPS